MASAVCRAPKIELAASFGFDNSGCNVRFEMTPADHRHSRSLMGAGGIYFRSIVLS